MPGADVHYFCLEFPMFLLGVSRDHYQSHLRCLYVTHVHPESCYTVLEVFHRESRLRLASSIMGLWPDNRVCQADQASQPHTA